MSTTIYSSPLDSILHIHIQLLTLQSAFAPKGVFTPLGAIALLSVGTLLLQCLSAPLGASALLSALRFMLPLLLQRSQDA